MGRLRHIQLQLAPEEVSLLLRGLDLLQAEDEFTQQIQPAQSRSAVAAVTRLQAIEMMRAVLERA